MSDPIDDLLDRSAPALADRGSAREAGLTQMASDARDTVRPAKRTRRRTGILAVALSGALLVCGGGVAVAAGLVEWPAGFEDPDSSFAFTLPSGRACEVRLVVEDVEREPAEGESRAQEEVDRWLNSVDLQAVLDVDAAEHEAKAILASQNAVGMTVVIGEDGWLTDASREDHEPTPDDVRAFAIDRAVGSAMREHLNSIGLPANEWTFGADGGVKCAAE